MVNHGSKTGSKWTHSHSGKDSSFPTRKSSNLKTHTLKLGHRTVMFVHEDTDRSTQFHRIVRTQGRRSEQEPRRLRGGQQHQRRKSNASPRENLSRGEETKPLRTWPLYRSSTRKISGQISRPHIALLIFLSFSEYSLGYRIAVIRGRISV